MSRGVKIWLTTFAAGLLFALGLGVSGMTDANKVIGFLDVGGDWDPSLAFVMIGAIGVHMLLYRFILKQKSPVFADKFGIPTRSDVDLRLVAGGALFGLGWGLSGFCPGPGLVSILKGGGAALVFVATMVAGMLLFHVAQALWAERRPSDVEETPSPESSLERAL